uniref:Uncharacterized protein n=1 Tax=Arundo donax TaxID=35708 RepID=A0A0A8YZ90_ARUDO
MNHILKRKLAILRTPLSS